MLSTTLFNGAAAASTVAASGAAPPLNAATIEAVHPERVRERASLKTERSCSTATETVMEKQRMDAVDKARVAACRTTNMVSSSILLIIAPCIPGC